MSIQQTKQKIDRLRAKIGRMERTNARDLQEMAERGKELVKAANIVRSCKDLMEEQVYNNLIEIVNKFESRCEKIRRKRSGKAPGPMA